jgi:glutaredoxin
MAVVTLYSRPGCHLCDEARAVLLRLREQRPFELVEHDIDRDEQLQRSYFDRIPVIALDGEELFDYFVDEPALRARLGDLD